MVEYVGVQAVSLQDVILWELTLMHVAAQDLPPAPIIQRIGVDLIN